MMAGIVSLPRMIVKTNAYAENTLGDYDVECPHDKPVLAVLDIDFATSAAKIKELNYDNGTVEAWAKPLVDEHRPTEIDASTSRAAIGNPMDTRNSILINSKPRSLRIELTSRRGLNFSISTKIARSRLFIAWRTHGRGDRWFCFLQYRIFAHALRNRHSHENFVRVKLLLTVPLSLLLDAISYRKVWL